jgi:hypothetical protein
MTPDELLKDARFLHTDSRAVAVNGRFLSPYLSLQFQNIQSGSHLIICPKRPSAPAPSRPRDLSEERLAAVELEYRRITDLGFAVWENSRDFPAILVATLADQEAEEDSDDCGQYPTVIQSTSRLSDAPLPSLWQSARVMKL